MTGTPIATATSTARQVENFVLSVHVPGSPGQSGVMIDDPTDYPPMALISKGFQNFGKEIPTFIDSGASDTMFVSRVLCIIFVKFFLPIIPTFRFRSRRYFISY